ncbi:6367_t:CDS:2, partial [Racocetra persica]
LNSRDHDLVTYSWWFSQIFVGRGITLEVSVQIKSWRQINGAAVNVDGTV